ncbi:MAG: MBL fold metallo-hydrolase [Armatimonadota bacterium]
MTALAQSIAQTTVRTGELALFSLAQAGFVLKTSVGTTLAIDPYLTDSVERLAGFKRLIPAPITPEELNVDFIAITHNHPDHLDPDALPAWAGMRMRFIVAPDSVAPLREAGIADERVTILREGYQRALRDLSILAVYADHGELAPDAVGFLIEAGGITVHNVGDSGFAPERMLAGLPAVDVMIAPINGAYGNLNEEEACRLAALARPRWLIGSHTGMFEVHGGNPARFLELARALDGIEALTMQPGECRIFTRAEGRR